MRPLHIVQKPRTGRLGRLRGRGMENIWKLFGWREGRPGGRSEVDGCAEGEAEDDGEGEEDHIEDY